MGFSHQEIGCNCSSRLHHLSVLAGEILSGDTCLKSALGRLSRTRCKKGGLVNKARETVKEFLDAIEATDQIAGL